MSNEFKDWLWDKLGDVLLEANAVDKILEVIPWYDDFAGVVHGVKNGIHVKYNVFMDDDSNWDFEEAED